MGKLGTAGWEPEIFRSRFENLCLVSVLVHVNGRKMKHRPFMYPDSVSKIECVRFLPARIARLLQLYAALVLSSCTLPYSRDHPAVRR